MMKILKHLKNDYSGEGITLLRISFGIMLAVVHGWATLKGFFDGIDDFPDPLGIGSRWSMGLMGFAEFVCAILVVLGVYTRLALVPIIIGFMVGFFIFHAQDAFGDKEMALHYLLIFLVLFITGPGKYTLTDLFKQRNAS